MYTYTYTLAHAFLCLPVYLSTPSTNTPEPILISNTRVLACQAEACRAAVLSACRFTVQGLGLRVRFRSLGSPCKTPRKLL